MKHSNLVIVCDDGSKDLTGEIAERMGAYVIKHKSNMGYGAAIQSLFKVALDRGAETVITLDADGQHNPESIPTLLNTLKKTGADIVIGSRFIEGGGSDGSLWRNKGIEIITNLTSNDELKITDAQSGFRAYNRKALESLNIVEDGMGVSTEILIKAKTAGMKIVEAPIYVKYPEKSSIHNPIFHGLSVIMSTVKHMSMRHPLLFYGLPGFISFCIAAFFWIWILQIFSIERRIVTNLAIIALGTTMIGLIFLTTSVILWVLVSILRESLEYNQK
jgi:glycosyltransferase involved in cell wall biosynthesis